MLELQNICFTRDNKKILDNVNIKFEDNKFIAITGPNGSGKSMLAKVIMGIVKPDSGKILLDGEDITEKSIDERARMGLGFAFQQPVKFKGITVFDLLKIAAKRDLTKAEACDCLSKVGLCAREYVDREVNSSLSGGELKRIEIATVELREAKFTIFDEPEAGIDIWSFKNLITVFENMQNIIKGTTVVISHQERILNIADYVILMKNGQVEKITTAHEVISSSHDVKTECIKLTN
ncbi:MAG: ATP-binding cassette domain-containing protein [Clostridia bacterium]|nr:ATP-binding cassette domain-containing protein [Clostridia bacterium]